MNNIQFKFLFIKEHWKLVISQFDTKQKQQQKKLLSKTENHFLRHIIYTHFMLFMLLFSVRFCFIAQQINKHTHTHTFIDRQGVHQTSTRTKRYYLCSEALLVNLIYINISLWNIRLSYSFKQTILYVQGFTGISISLHIIIFILCYIFQFFFILYPIFCLLLLLLIEYTFISIKFYDNNKK